MTFFAMSSALTKPSWRTERSSTFSMICFSKVRRSCSKPLRPTQKNLTSLPWFISASARSRASRTIDELNAPDRPRSPVQTRNRCTWSLPVPASSAGAPGEPAAALAILEITASIFSA